MLKEISVEYASGICDACGEHREIYSLSGFLYGERLLLTKDGKFYAYLNCFEDTAFDEVDIILKKLTSGKNLSQQAETDCFNKTFGVSCDLVSGVEIDAFKIKEACIKCGSERLTVKENYPPDIVKVLLPTATHTAWNRLSTKEKEDLIFVELKQKGCI